MKSLVIGAGVGGLFFANLYDGQALIIDKNEFAGRKLLATGNGRCNFTNLNMGQEFYRSSNPGFYKYLIEKYDNHDLIDFFEKRGLLTTNLESGRCYPETLSSKTVRDILYMNSKEKSKFLFETEVLDIDFDKKLVICEDKKIPYDNLIIATGGISLAGSGSDGKIFEIIKKVHKVTRLSYGITNYKAKNPLSKKAKGVRVRARASLYIDDKYIGSSTDDVIFQNYGLTGTAIFDLSNDISYGLFEKKPIRVEVDLLSAYEFKTLVEIIEKLAKAHPNWDLYDLLRGLLNEKLIGDIIKRSGLGDKKASDLTNKEIKKLVGTIKALKFDLIAINDKENAQVTIGGVDSRYIDNKTCQSKIIDGLYFIGEVIDVDGACGGYNIQWAYSSARAVCQHLRSNNVKNK